MAVLARRAECPVGARWGGWGGDGSRGLVAGANGQSLRTSFPSRAEVWRVSRRRTAVSANRVDCPPHGPTPGPERGPMVSEGGGTWRGSIKGGAVQAASTVSMGEWPEKNLGACPHREWTAAPEILQDTIHRSGHPTGQRGFTGRTGSAFRTRPRVKAKDIHPSPTI